MFRTPKGAAWSPGGRWFLQMPCLGTIMGAVVPERWSLNQRGCPKQRAGGGDIDRRELRSRGQRAHPGREHGGSRQKVGKEEGGS